ncbi:site-specific recombinase XerD [Acidipila rosea]|uniref:Site-specific recombinase XerD n=1 Tax=Acidipila rosea TaxID=768535 RepID=A0A4R1L8Z4_9BACT|nr:site-specific recombinase XerD [Acidipila rosea]
MERVTLSTTTRNHRYQEGTIDRSPRVKGADVWTYRWRDIQEDGRRVQRKQIIGDVDRYPTKADAKRAVENLRAEINARQERLGKMTIEEAWGHFQANELRDPDVCRSETTIENYLTLFKAHIIPRWGKTFLSEMKAVEVESWLRSLHHLAPSSRAKLKSRMYTLFEHAKRYEFCDRNPMGSVRQGSKPRIKPAVLALEEIRAIMDEITTPAIRVAVLVAAATGLRRSELRGLKWKDLDLDGGWLTPSRGSVNKYLTNLKNRPSAATIPISEALAEALLMWRKETPYRADDDWVFASPATSGRSPYWFDAALTRQLRPAAKRAKVNKHIGWHTFRRSLATLLMKKGEGVKVVQELMRHANSKITLDVYAQGDEEAKRAAQNHVNELFIVPSKAS